MPSRRFMPIVAFEWYRRRKGGVTHRGPMPQCVSMPRSTPTPLLALVGATAEWQAGTPPSCSARVRLLDRVHFTVHRGDCVVVHHDDPASARVLLAALAGSPALIAARRLSGWRLAAPAVRVRRCSVTRDALDAVVDGWRDVRPDDEATPSLPANTPSATVHLLRASRPARLSRRERDHWRAWAVRVRRESGAVVAVASPHPVGVVRRPVTPFTWPIGADRRDASLPPDRVRESRRQDAPPPEQMLAAAAPRGVWLRHGQLLNLRTWE